MKLSTMRLPSGEFIIVASNARKTDSLRDTMVSLKEATGAAAFFATDDDVEVVDADQSGVDAVRRETEKRENLFTSLYFPNLHIDSFGPLIDGQVEFSATALPAQDSLHFDTELSPEDIAVTRAIMEGHEFSPAGLVIEGGRLVHGTLPAEEQGTPGADPEPDGDFNDDIAEPFGHAVEEDDEPIGPPEPRPFVAGDRVVVNGSSWLNTVVKDFVGIVEVVPDRSRRYIEDTVERQGFSVRVREVDGSGRTMYFRPEDVTHIEED